MSEQALTIRDPQLPPEPADLAVFKPPITPAQAKIDAVANLTMKAYERASTLQLTPEEVAALQADFPDEAFQPGAAGKENLIYIEHAHLRDRLNQVFGPGQWSIVPRNRWAEDYSFTNKYKETVEASRVYVEAMLCVRGCFVAEAVGDMVYYKNNESQNYGDAVEGAKTAALRRCAKELGIGLQAWKKDWCLGWWERRRGTKEPPKPPAKDNAKATPITATGTAKPPAARSEPGTAGKPTQATEKTREWFLREMLFRFDKPVLLQYFCDKGPPYALMPNQGLEELRLDFVPTTPAGRDAVIADVAKFMNIEPRKVGENTQNALKSSQSDSEGKTARAGNENATAPAKQAPTVAQSASCPKCRHVASQSEALVDTWACERCGWQWDKAGKYVEAHAWATVICPIPPKGTTKATYDKAGPLTLGQIMRTDNKRFYGIVMNNQEAKGWIGRDGKQHPPSAADERFAEACRAAVDHMEAQKQISTMAGDDDPMEGDPMDEPPF